MARAIELALRGEGAVEPNPMVGCVIMRDGETIGEGFHARFGSPHAEVEALAVAASRAHGADVYVTLEPCCHHGKTPPCTQALISAGVRRVIVAQRDPFAKVAGQGIAELERAGIEVQVGLLESEARALNAPYLKLLAQGRPWIIAKWAMTLDGKLATRSGDSRWISSPASRGIVHALRGRVDAIMVGRGTAAADDPLLTARPAGLRTATRIVLDSLATLPSDSQLARTAHDGPVIMATCGRSAPGRSPATGRRRLRSAGLPRPFGRRATRLAARRAGAPPDDQHPGRGGQPSVRQPVGCSRKSTKSTPSSLPSSWAGRRPHPPFRAPASICWPTRCCWTPPASNVAATMYISTPASGTLSTAVPKSFVETGIGEESGLLRG